MKYCKVSVSLFLFGVFQCTNHVSSQSALEQLDLTERPMDPERMMRTETAAPRSLDIDAPGPGRMMRKQTAAARSLDTDAPDVYWRPWKNNLIPKDAIVAFYREGGDCGHYPVFVAQVFLQKPIGALLPGEVLHDSTSVYYTYDEKLYAQTSNIKILCSDDSSIITWLPKSKIKSYDIEVSDDCVPGGSASVYIGKTTYEKKPVLGKVVGNRIYIRHGDKEISLDDYEILCYTESLLVKGLYIPPP